ncbi:MAG: hypothetical protein A2Y58_00960 [Chloroflexi bacterium RBG_13_51_52]|nr:MAG: hypothetical protein A2Y58_00960 [Chloroflexi bacterium RBG_13_51_52]
MDVIFDKNAAKDSEVEKTVLEFFDTVDSLERTRNVPVYIFQDGVKKSYYVRCVITGKTMSRVVSLDARLNPESGETFRDNREILQTHNTFLRMKADANNEREFSDLIAEYNTSYLPEKPLKIWGGQHRSRAIIDAYAEKKVSRYHGFRVYLCLSKEQRTELALISNTSIAVSNDLFDRQLEETYMGPHLRRWCTKVGLLKQGEDFPDVGSHSEKITTQAARSFVVNYFKGKQTGEQIKDAELDKNVYEPYLCQTGIFIDEEYRQLTEKMGGKIWTDKGLQEAAKAYAGLHKAQYNAIKKSKSNFKVFRMKAMVPSVLTAWSYVAGLLQAHEKRLSVHLTVPPPPKGVPDPLNAEEMAIFRYYQDVDTYRGLGTRAIMKDRQRMAQVFLARSLDAEATLDKKLLNQAVNQFAALRFFAKGYTTN